MSIDQTPVAEVPGAQMQVDDIVSSDPWTRIRVKDNLGYQRDYVKSEDENLYSLARDYARTHQMDPWQILLISRGTVISQDQPIRSLCLYNGDTITPSVNISALFPITNPYFVRELCVLSPTDVDGRPYLSYNGPLTRPDERRLKLLIQNVWPGVPPILLTVRAKENTTVSNVLQVIGKTFTLAQNRVEILNCPANSQTKVFEHLPGEGFFIVQYRARENNPVSRWGCHFASITDEEPDLNDAILLVIDEVAPTSPGWQAPVGIIALPTHTIGEILVWLRNNSEHLQGPGYLHRTWYWMKPDRTLESLGFVSGGEYSLDFRRGQRPSWMKEPDLAPGETDIKKFLDDAVLRIKASDMGRTPNDIVKGLFGEGFQNDLRFVWDGERLMSDKTLGAQAVTIGARVDVELLQEGGARRAGRIPTQDTMRIDVPYAAAPGTIVGYQVIRVSQAQFNSIRLSTEPLTALRVPPNTILIIDTPLASVARPDGHLRLVVEHGGTIPITVVMPVTTPFEPIRRYFESRCRRSIQLLYHGHRVPSEACCHELAILDGSTISITSPPRSDQARRGEARNSNEDLTISAGTDTHLSARILPAAPVVLSSAQTVPLSAITNRPNNPTAGYLIVEGRFLNHSIDREENFPIQDGWFTDITVANFRTDTFVMMQAPLEVLNPRSGILRLRISFEPGHGVIVVCSEHAHIDALAASLSKWLNEPVRLCCNGIRLINGVTMDEQDVEDGDELDLFREQVGGGGKRRRDEPTDDEETTEDETTDEAEQTEDEEGVASEGSQYTETRSPLNTMLTRPTQARAPSQASRRSATVRAVESLPQSSNRVEGWADEQRAYTPARSERAVSERLRASAAPHTTPPYEHATEQEKEQQERQVGRRSPAREDFVFKGDSASIGHRSSRSRKLAPGVLYQVGEDGEAREPPMLTRIDARSVRSSGSRREGRPVETRTRKHHHRQDDADYRSTCSQGPRNYSRTPVARTRREEIEEDVARPSIRKHRRRRSFSDSEDEEDERPEHKYDVRSRPPSHHSSASSGRGHQYEGSYTDRRKILEGKISKDLPYTRIPGVEVYVAPTKTAKKDRPIKNLMRSGQGRLVHEFKGKQAREWLERYEAVGRLERATPGQLVDHLQFNVSASEPNIWARVKKHPAYRDRNLEWIKHFLLTGFEGPESQKCTPYDLDAWIEKPRSIETVEQFNDYTNNFQELADPLLNYNSLTSLQYVEKFHRGLPKNIREELSRRYKMVERPTFEQINRMVHDIVNPESFFDKWNQTITRTFNKKSHKEDLSEPKFSIDRAEKHEEIAKLVSALQIGLRQIPKKQEGKPATNTTAKQHASSANQSRPPNSLAMNTSTVATDPSSKATGANAIPVGSRDSARTCMYCNGTDHYKMKCPTLNDHINKHHVYVDSKDRMVRYMNGETVQGHHGHYGQVVDKKIKDGTIPAAPASEAVASANVHELASDGEDSDYALEVDDASEAGSESPDQESGLCTLSVELDDDGAFIPVEAIQVDPARQASGPKKPQSQLSTRTAKENLKGPTRIVLTTGRNTRASAQARAAQTAMDTGALQARTVEPTAPSGSTVEDASVQAPADTTPGAPAQESAIARPSVLTPVQDLLPPAPVKPTATNTEPPATMEPAPRPTSAERSKVPTMARATEPPITQVLTDPEDDDEMDELDDPDIVPADGTGKRFISTKVPPLNKRLRVSRLRREIDPKRIGEDLLDSEVTMKWRDVVGLSPYIERYVKHQMQTKVVPFPTTGHVMPWLEKEDARAIVQNSVAVDMLPEEAHEEIATLFVNQLRAEYDGIEAWTTAWYTSALPMSVADVHGNTLRVLLDTGSQINTIRKDLQHQLGLAMRHCGKHHIVGAGLQQTALLGIVEDVPITFHGIKMKVHLWVADKSGYDLLFGMPALREMKAIIHCDEGYITIKDGYNRTIQLPVVRTDDPAHTNHMDYKTHEVSTFTVESGEMGDDVVVDPDPTILSRSPYALQVNAKAKKVADKIKPEAPVGPDWKPRIMIPPKYDRDPYETRVDPHAPDYIPSGKLTEARIAALKLDPKGLLRPQERNMLLHTIDMHQKALAFDESERGFLNPDYGEPYRFYTEPHPPLLGRSIPIPDKWWKPAKKLFREYIKAGILEDSSSPHAVPYFFIQKQNGDLRLIIDSTMVNKHTTGDAGIMPFPAEVIDGLVGRVSYWYGDLMSYYHQLLAHPAVRIYAALRTPYGLKQLTTLAPGHCTSPAEAQRTTNHCLGEDQMNDVFGFMDDIVGGGPTSRYDDELLPGTQVRRWVYEHCVVLERVLYRFAHANLVFSAKKMVFITDEVEIIGVRISARGKSVDPAKVDKLQAWPNPCPSQASLRGFLGLANFLRPYIHNFASLDAPLRVLVGKTWGWSPEATTAVQAIKEAAARAPYLTVIDYESGDPIVLSVDSSNIATGFVLSQDRPEGRRIAHFDSVAFTDVERRYSQPKLELCGVYKAIRKMRYRLIGTKFILEVDAMSLIHMINQPDVANAPMARWIANLKQFDFEIRHVPGKQHSIPDGLSRTDFNNPESAEDLGGEDDRITCLVNTTAIGAVSPDGPAPQVPMDTTDFPQSARTVQKTGKLGVVKKQLPRIHFDDAAYDKDLRLLGLWLSTGGEHPEVKNLQKTHKRGIRRKLGKFLVKEGRLYKLDKDGTPLVVVGNKVDRRTAFEMAHDQTGHRGVNACLATLMRRVWWPSMRKDTATYIASCHVCQMRDPKGEGEPARAAPISRLFEQFGLDIVDLGANTGPRRYLVVARCLLTGWVEARALPNKLASSVAKFIEDDILSRYGPVIKQILTDNGPENGAETDALLRRLGLRHARITPHHPQGNSVVERGHAPLVHGLLTAAFDDRERTHTYLPQILWADRITVRATTGQSSFELVYGYEPLLPIDHEFTTFQIVDWNEIRTTAQLLAARARQLRRRDTDLAHASVLIDAARRRNRSYHDEAMADRLREPIPSGELVLVRSLSKFLSKSEDRWIGPYRVVSTTPSGSYELAELDGSQLKTPVGSDRIRRYHLRPRPIQPSREALDSAVDGTFDEPLAGPPPPAMPTPSPEAPFLPAPTAPLRMDNDLPPPTPSPSAMLPSSPTTTPHAATPPTQLNATAPAFLPPSAVSTLSGGGSVAATSGSTGREQDSA